MSSCSGLNVQSLVTPYNENKDVLTYTGIMFQISASKDIEILTIEFDARYDDIKATDLSLEVYTKPNEYIDFVNVPGEWDLVADAVAIPVSTKSNLGVIIPHRQFRPITIPKGGTQSLYITMLSGSYIDFNVDALQKTGEIMMQSQDLALSVGSGFSEPRFPYAGINRTVSPMFSGVIHYRTKDCVESGNSTGTMTSSSTINFPFLLSIPAVSVELQAAIQNAVATSIETILVESGSTLQQFHDQYQLRRDTKGTIVQLVDYSGECSNEWSHCPSQYVDASVTFSKQNSLDSGMVKYEVYKKLSEVIMATARAVASIPVGQEVKVAYIGHKAVEADYRVELDGVSGENMSKDQEEYFSEVMTSFLSESMILNDATVLVTTVSSGSDPKARQNLRTLQVNAASNSISISGTVLGSQAAYKPVEMFHFALDDAFSLDAVNFEKKLEYVALKPSETNDSSISDYFFNVRLKSGLITSVSETNPFQTGNSSVPTSTSPQTPTTTYEWPVSTILMFVGAGIATFVGVFLIFQFVRRVKAERKCAKQREARREKENQGNLNLDKFSNPRGRSVASNSQHSIESSTRNASNRQRSRSTDRPRIPRSRSNDNLFDKTVSGKQRSRSADRPEIRRARSNDNLFDKTVSRKQRSKSSDRSQIKRTRSSNQLDLASFQNQKTEKSNNDKTREKSQSKNTSSPRTISRTKSLDHVSCDKSQGRQPLNFDRPKIQRAKSSDTLETCYSLESSPSTKSSSPMMIKNVFQDFPDRRQQRPINKADKKSQSTPPMISASDLQFNRSDSRKKLNKQPSLIDLMKKNQKKSKEAAF